MSKRGSIPRSILSQPSWKRGNWKSGDRHYAPPLKCRGFFFAGIIPERNNGDVLRFEYLSNVKTDPGKSVVVSDFGKYLFDYIRREHERAARSIRCPVFESAF